MFFKNTCKFQKNTFLKTQTFRKSTAVPKTQPNHASIDYQYLQKCPLPTLHFQKSLLRLPIPELDNTCERYLNALKPLLNTDQYEKTKNVVHNFKQNEGKELQALLKAKDASNKHTSYISKPWFDMYLKDRSPLPLNYNPALAFVRSECPDAESQLCKATNLTISSLRFMNSLKNNILAPEVFHLNPEKTNTNFFFSCMRVLPSIVASYGAYLLKAYPLDMSQYSSLFSSTRIPQEGKDILVKDDSGKHVVVLRKGHFFLMNVLDDKGDILPPEDIYTCLKHIISKNLIFASDSVGVLTTENRDVWAKAREHLVSIHPDNFQSIKAIDSALFVLCLDDQPLGDDPVKIIRCFLHGNGSNRWFDKSFSLIVAGDGLAGVNFEHSWGDGVAVLRYFKDIHTNINESPYVDSRTEASKINPEDFIRELDFKFDEKVSSDVRSAKANYEKVCSSLGVNAVEHQGLGRNFCKTAKISPDALMQLSFQVAYHKVYGNFVSTYESCSTAAFKHGRTETLRPCTEATKKFSETFNSKNKPGKEELLALMYHCSEVHKKLTKEAVMGMNFTRHRKPFAAVLSSLFLQDPSFQGFDRHLFGLRHICEEQERPLPDLYKDEAYKVINYNILSTSTLVADAVLLGGFGPVVPDGLGVGYTILDNYCGSMVTSYPARKNGVDYANALKCTFDELSSLLGNK